MYPLLSDVLIRFRNHAIGFSADIGMMFREIVLHPEERDLHRLFRRNEADKIEICRMKRLTFGIRSSPFLATQTIRDLAETHRKSNPNASQAILHDFYVDDFLSGASTIDKTNALRVELCSLLQSAGMTLRKWRTNSCSFRDTIPQDLIETADLQLPAPLASTKALGMHWDVQHNTLHVATPEAEDSSITKRLVASRAAKIYDIMGLFTPATITAKIILQEA